MSNSAIGIRVAPRWQVLPADGAVDPGAMPIRLDAGPGFGDGSHPTTQLCLEGIAALARRDQPWRLLDVGSGSGILSIAGAALGAMVDAVEIDAAAMEHAMGCFRSNGVEDRVRSFSSLDEVVGPYDLVVANVWRAVLLQLAADIARLRAPGGSLLLSGLVSTDVPEVSFRYAGLIDGRRPEIYERDEWRALLWRGR